MPPLKKFVLPLNFGDDSSHSVDTRNGAGLSCKSLS